MFDHLLRPTWVDVGDGLSINVDSHIRHFSGIHVIDLEDPEVLQRFNENCRLLLMELKRRVERGE